MFYFLAKCSFLLVVLLLCACVGGGNYAPVVESQSGYRKSPPTFVVSRGETLYSIAFRYNLDFRGLAAANNMRYPYTIYPGQTLLLSDAARVTKSTAKPTSKPAKSTVSKSAGSAAKVSKHTSSNSVSKSQSIDRSRYPFTWRWPLRGKVIRAYSASGHQHKGIDIEGKLGEPVHAANSGEVVYAGSGLVGYGKLLIIKHNETYLSAYGHNSKLLVKEGQKVKVGQKIAEVGDTGTDKPKLHFEIRRDGKPVNPTRVLPGK